LRTHPPSPPISITAMLNAVCMSTGVIIFF
jgi:hypothetical protein